MRWCIKTIAGCSRRVSGVLCTAIPIVGPILTALLSGWGRGMGYCVRPPSLAWDGLEYFVRACRYFIIFGTITGLDFWAVLIEEIPIVNPVCHVYNVYSAAFFLERVYFERWYNREGGGRRLTV